MKQLLRSINLSTKFQILVEVAANQPDIQQRDIAERLELSPQAVSDYVKELVQADWLSSEGRSKYRITMEGVNWMLREIREWQGYTDTVQKALAGVSVCAAVAGSQIKKGQKVGLSMHDGLLYASINPDAEAGGTAVSDANNGEDVGITDIYGIVPLKIGKVTVLTVPGIQKGGSSQANITKLKRVATDRQTIGGIGIEALIALKKANIEPTCIYGVREAIVEAALSGLSPLVVCVDSDTSSLLQMLEKKDIDYDIINGRKAKQV